MIEAKTVAPRQMPLVVTLIHGTWARNAPWTQDGSALRQALAAAFGNDTVFRPFNWSGDNAFSARAAAAAELNDFLLAGMTERPTATHVVVAHSHGGNVALEALRDFDHAARVAAVVCLATPFISTRTRRFGEHTDVVVGLAKSMASVAAGAAASLALMRAFDAGEQLIWMWISLVVWLAVGFGTWRVLSKLGGAWQRHADAWAAKVRVSLPKPPTKLFVVRAAADEAFEGLTASRIPAKVMLAGWSGLASIALFPLRLAAAVDAWARQRFYRRVVTAAGLWVAFAAYIYPFAAGSPNESMLPLLLGYVAVLLLVAALRSTEVGLFQLVGFLAVPLFILLGGVFLLVLLLLSLVVLPFNTSVRDLLPFLKVAVWLGPIDINAESTPPGVVDAVYQMAEDVQSGLRHSSPYSDPDALRNIVEWLRRV